MLLDPQVHPISLAAYEDGHDGFVGTPTPRLHWRLQAQRTDVLQHAYALEVSPTSDFSAEVVSSGRVDSCVPGHAPWPAQPLASRAVRWARVKVWTDQGETAWSEPLRIEAALLTPEDWTARPVSPVSNVAQSQPCPVPLLRRAFALDRPVASARLYITSLGVFDCWINGRRVGDALLDPGWTSYQQRLHYAAYDVTPLLEAGENVLSAAVGDGWWRGWLTWMQRRAIYGDTTALLAQLEITYADGSVQVVGTDESWQGGYGALLSADLYNGCDVDLRREPFGWKLKDFDAKGWEKVESLDLPRGLTLRCMPPIRQIETRNPTLSASAWGTVMVDAGQNLAGYLRIRVRGPEGASIRLRHAEMLDNEGRLYVAPLRHARATDTYVLDGRAGTVELVPSFTFHGFRHAEIEADPGVEIMGVEVCVLASDLEQIGTFACSNPQVNRLYQNVRWSQFGNFLSIPTDCPQRDERLGWTGDIQVFAETACTNADARTFLSSWLRDLAIEQRADGCVTSTVPNVVQNFEYEYGGVGWGDAASLVPWDLYQSYGDPEILARQYASIKAWVDWCASRLGPDDTWTGDFHLGDWLDPNAPADQPEKATTDRDLIASAYLARSARVLGQSATILGHDDDAMAYEALADRVAQAAWRRWQDVALTTQTGAAICICFGIVPSEMRDAAVSALADLVDRNDGRIATGFLGTPLVLPALTLGNRVDAAYRLLLNRACPGWLYQVDRGATTMWERWDAVQEDGRLHTGSMAMEEGADMISFNHYAYGAVAAWLYQSVAGIAPDTPGYARIRFAPRPGGGLDHASARILTPYGEASIAWRLSADVLDVHCLVPAGATARADWPQGWSVAAPAEFGSGHHHFTLQRG